MARVETGNSFLLDRMSIGRGEGIHFALNKEHQSCLWSTELHCHYPTLLGATQTTGLCFRHSAEMLWSRLVAWYSTQWKITSSRGSCSRIFKLIFSNVSGKSLSVYRRALPSSMKSTFFRSPPCDGSFIQPRKTDPISGTRWHSLSTAHQVADAREAYQHWRTHDIFSNSSPSFTWWIYGKNR